MLLLISIFVLQAGSVSIDAEGWARKAKPIAICTDGADCDLKWKRARTWVSSHSKFQIAVDSPTILATYGPVYTNVDLSFVVTKRARLDGRFDIAARAWCGNVITCKPKPKDAVSNLSRALETD